MFHALSQWESGPSDPFVPEMNNWIKCYTYFYCVNSHCLTMWTEVRSYVSVTVWGLHSTFDAASTKLHISQPCCYAILPTHIILTLRRWVLVLRVIICNVLFQGRYHKKTFCLLQLQDLKAQHLYQFNAPVLRRIV